MKFIKNNWKIILLAIVLIAVYLFLGIKNLTSFPIFADEAIYIRWSQVMRNEPTLRFLPLSDGKQPLFMWATIPFFKIFSNPLFAGRLLSVFTGLMTLIGIFCLSQIFFKNKKVSLIAALIYALSPFILFFNRMALADSMLSMFGVWSLFFAILAAKFKRLDLSMITGFFLGGALLTKSPALFFSLLLPLSWLFSDWPKSFSLKVKNFFSLLILFIPTYVIAYGMYNILRLGPNFNMLSQRNMDYVYPFSHFLVSIKDPFLPFFDRSFEWIRKMGPSIVLILAGLGIIVNFKKFKKELFILFVWFLAPIAVQSEFAKVFTARYILFTLPYLFIIAASLFLTENRIIKKLAILLLILNVFLALRFDYLLIYDFEKANLPRSERSGYLEEWSSGYGIREVGDFIREQYLKNPSKKIVVGTEGFFGTLPDGLQIYLNDLRDITVIGVGLNFDEVNKSLLDSKKAGNLTYFVVNNTRFAKNGEDMGLTLLASYPKAVRPDGYREALLLFEVDEKAVKIYSNKNKLK